MAERRRKARNGTKRVCGEMKTLPLVPQHSKYHNQSLLESTLPSRELLPSPKSSPGRTRTGESGPLSPPQDNQKSGDVRVPACQGEESG